MARISLTSTSRRATPSTKGAGRPLLRGMAMRTPTLCEDRRSLAALAVFHGPQPLRCASTMSASDPTSVGVTRTMQGFTLRVVSPIWLAEKPEQVTVGRHTRFDFLQQPEDGPGLIQS